MEYGIFTSPLLEIAQTKFWSLCLSCNYDKSIISAELYNGIDNNKSLVAIVRRNMANQTTIYGYKTPIGKVVSNDNEICMELGKQYDYTINGMIKNDTIELTEPHSMSSVSEKGIAFCLKQWRIGTFYHISEDGMQFLLVTNKVEYIFSINQDNANIYCGASVNIPFENGLLGCEQYFRIRNYADNSKPFCGFHCDLGNNLFESETQPSICETGKCTRTPQGLFWPVKQYDDDMIILSGCGGDEYIYERNKNRSEYFCIEK